MSVWPFIVGVCFVGLATWAAWLWRELRELRLDLDAERTGFELVSRAYLDRRWIEWWARNAAETTALDGGRIHLLRFALAAQLAPDLAQFERDLHSIVTDRERPDVERHAAKSILSERQVAARTKELPWEAWMRETRKPEHNPEVLREVYACALHSWMAVFTRSRDESLPADRDDVPDRTH